jgi:guanylate kinase
MIYCLLGKTCSGKTTALKQLIEIGLNPIIEYTTRPQRNNEVNGREYYFSSVSHFKQLSDSNLLVAELNYEIAKDIIWSYAIHVEDINMTKDHVIVTSPNGYRALTDSLGKRNVVGIYLNSPEVTRLSRGANRGDNTYELIRRLKADEIDFEGFENEVDHVITGLEKKAVFESILEHIFSRVKL